AFIAIAVRFASCTDGSLSPRQRATTPQATRGGEPGGPDLRVALADAIMMLRTPSAAAGARGGTTLDVDAVLVKRNGKEKDKDKHIDWTSSNVEVATVDSSGF